MFNLEKVATTCSTRSETVFLPRFHGMNSLYSSSAVCFIHALSSSIIISFNWQWQDIKPLPVRTCLLYFANSRSGFSLFRTWSFSMWATGLSMYPLSTAIFNVNRYLSDDFGIWPTLKSYCGHFLFRTFVWFISVALSETSFTTWLFGLVILQLTNCCLVRVF